MPEGWVGHLRCGKVGATGPFFRGGGHGGCNVVKNMPPKKARKPKTIKVAKKRLESDFAVDGGRAISRILTCDRNGLLENRFRAFGPK